MDPDEATITALLHAVDADTAPDTIARIAAGFDPTALVAEIAGSPDPERRGYGPRVAVILLGERALPTLLRLLDDPDADVRGIALDELEGADPAAVRRLIPSLRKRLATARDYEALSIAWRLAALRDVESIPSIRAFRDSYPASNWQHKAGDVVLTMLTDAQSIPRRIREHDHEHMPWLTHAASLLGTDDATSALIRCSAEAPDQRCRADCQAEIRA